jgi:hypothetical protein
MDKNGNLPLYGEIMSGACVSVFDSMHCLLTYISFISSIYEMFRLAA